MGHQSLSPAWPREVAPELRSLAETVWRLVQRDSSHTALHMVSRALRDLPERSERRAYLINLRGIVYAQQHREAEAIADFATAAAEAPSWHVPLYNLGLCHKQAHRFKEAREVFLRAIACVRGRPGKEPSRPALWNLAIAQTALSAWDEARASWRALGMALPAGSGPPELDLGLAQLSLPTKGPYAAERVWVQRLCPARARILSVVRYGAPCQFGDVVLCDEGVGHTGYYDGVVAHDGDPGRAGQRDASMIFLGTLEDAGYALHVVQGGPATPAQATALTERFREADLHIEVWSLTMRLPDVTVQPSENGALPLCAGLVIPGAGPEPQASAERAVAELTAAARELGLPMYAPTLMRAAGDEVGAARHKKALLKLGI
jgi:hypothetical protein